MEETPDLVSCPNCHRPITRHAAKEHLDTCLKENPIKIKVINGAEKEKSETNGKAAPNGEIAVMPPKSKKRKHDDSTAPLMKKLMYSGKCKWRDNTAKEEIY
jgi:hypothetical protein